MNYRPKHRRRGAAHQVFSTREFVPGHMLGAMILVGGVALLAGHFIEAEEEKKIQAAGR